MGESAFGQCTSLPVIDNIRYADTYLVEAVDKTLATYNIKQGTRFLGVDAFRDCTSLTSIDIPEGVTSIESYVFVNCRSITSVTIPSSVTSIMGNSVFSNVGNIVTPCILYAPNDFDFGDVDTSGDYFQWKGGYFKLSTEATITISSAGVGTFCCGKDLDFSSVTDFKAYVAMGYNQITGNVIVVEVKDAPAGTGLYLKGTPGTYKVPFGESGSYYMNMLVGITASITISNTDGGFTNFILTNDSSNGIGFYTFNGNYTMGANKAYLQIPTAMVNSNAGANFVGIEFEEGVTGIDKLSLTNENAVWYSLDGRRLSGKPTQKGFYVVNGRKVVIK